MRAANSIPSLPSLLLLPRRRRHLAGMAGTRCFVQARKCADARGRRCGTDANETTRTGRRKEWRRFDGIPPRPRHGETLSQEIGRGTRDVVANQGMQDGGETEETQVRNLPSDGNGARHRDVAGNGQEDAGRDHVREDVEREAFGIQAMPKVRIWGCGSAVPERQVSNDELALRMDTSDEWIAARTGIRNRRVVKQGQDLVELAATAARNAMERAQVDPVELDLVILATSSPDDLFGSACQLQHALGARNACAFDLTAACSGFVLATVTAAQYVRTGACRKVLVVGADALSRCVDWNDRGTCILFGDAAGAVLVTAHEEGTGTTKDADGTTPPRTDPTVGSCALLAFDMRSDGGGNRHLTARYLNPEDGDRTKPDGAERDRPASYANVRMNGQDVFKFAVRAVPATLKASAEKAGIGPEEFADKVDWLVLHQANQRILDAAADRLGFPKERVVSNLAHYGNTSAASIPLALDEAVRQGKIRPGDTVAIAGFGAGLTWASAIFRWG